MKRALVFGLVACSSVFVTSPSLADFVVLQAVNMRVMPGDIIPGGSSINIPDGSTIILMDEFGRKGRLTGPFEGVIGKQSEASKQAMAAEQAQKIATARQQRAAYFAPRARSRAGSPRVISGASASKATQSAMATGKVALDSISTLLKKASKSPQLASLIGNIGKSAGRFKFRAIKAPKTPDPWNIDIAASGNACITTDKNPEIWRKSATDKDMLTITDTSTEAKSVAEWAAGKNTVDWPTDLPLEAGHTYRFDLESGESPVEKTLFTTPDDLPTRSHTASWMSENNCDEQAMLLLVSGEVENMLMDMIDEGSF